jgi:hypothetical protein
VDRRTMRARRSSSVCWERERLSVSASRAEDSVRLFSSFPAASLASRAACSAADRRFRKSSSLYSINNGLINPDLCEGREAEGKVPL